MEGYTLNLFLHILSLVFWLGTDVGVFVLAGFAMVKEYTIDQRLLMLKVAMILDMFPRLFMVLTLPTGFHLAVGFGLIPAGEQWVTSVWIFSFFWLVTAMVSLLNQEQPIGKVAKIIEKGFQLALFIVLVWLGVSSLVGETPIIASWVAIKVLLYAATIGIIPLLERAFMPAILGFMALPAEGSSPELEAKIQRSMGFTYAWVIAIYILVFAAAYLGVAKTV